jgi:hypothetical protein
MLKTSLLAALLALPLGAQTANTANAMPNPLFVGLDQNGNVVSLGKLCQYQAGTTALATTYSNAQGTVANSNPLFLNGGGQAIIYGSGNYKFVLQAAGGDSNCPGTGAVIWTFDNYQAPPSQTPTFSTVTATTFNSTATGSTAAFQQYQGAFYIDGNGDAGFQLMTANTITLSGTGVTNVIGDTGGNFSITGAGNATFLSATGNTLGLSGLASAPSTVAAGTAVLYYDTTLGQLLYNIAGNGWVPFSVPGASSQVIYNQSGGFAASPNMIFDGSNLTLGGGVGTGVVASTFNSLNTGTNNAFQTNSGDFYVQGNGNLAAQQVTVGPAGFGIGTNSNTDTSGTITLSGGTYTLGWPSGHVYTTAPRCFTNDVTGLHASIAGATSTNIVFLGNGSDMIQYLCVFATY